MDEDLERYWLAGLLEGEGTFLKGPPSDPRCAIVRVAMTDQDVIEHSARLLARGVTPWDRKGHPPRKRVYITQVKGLPALELMITLRGVMGERRRGQIDAALAAPRPRHARANVRRATCRVTGCESPIRTRQLCRRHYRSWWKAKRYGRLPRHYPSHDLLPSTLAGGALEIAARDDARSLAWVAGLLEGEGTFTDAGGYPAISATMCDRDVLERAAAILGITKVSPKDVERNARNGWSPAFEIGITGARAAELMRQLRPYMGTRRSSEIASALAAYHPIRLTKAPEHCIASDCEEPHRGRGLCHKHYMSWSRDRARGREPRVRPLR